MTDLVERLRDPSDPRPVISLHRKAADQIEADATALTVLRERVTELERTTAEALARMMDAQMRVGACKKQAATAIEPKDKELAALRKNNEHAAGHLIDLLARAETAERRVTDLEEVLADKRRLAREINIALHGEDGAAKQASLVDLVHPARQLRRERDEAREALKPFTHIPLAYTDDIDDSATVFEYEGGAITLGDLRRAARAITGGKS